MTQFHYIHLDISGSSPEYRAALFDKLEYIDLYLWYVNLDDTESVTGDHYIALRMAEPEATQAILAELENIYKFCPVPYDDPDPLFKGTPTMPERFALKYPD